MTEAELDRCVRDLLRINKLYGYHTHNSRRSEAGWPDWCIIGTKIIFRELKTEHGKLTPQQRRVGYLIQQAGDDWRVWRPSDLRSGLINDELRLLRPRR